jgi:hypothetical protein
MDTIDVARMSDGPVTRDYSSKAFTGGSLNSVIVQPGKEEPAADGHAEREYHVAMARH